MRPSFTWRALIVTLGFVLTLGCAVPATYVPGLHGTLVRGPLALLYLLLMLLGMGIMAIGFTWPTVFFPEWVPPNGGDSPKPPAQGG